MTRADALNAAIARYTNPAAMSAHLEANPGDTARCWRIAVNPEGRFGLSTIDCLPVVEWMAANLDIQEALACSYVPTYQDGWRAGWAAGRNGIETKDGNGDYRVGFWKGYHEGTKVRFASGYAA